MTDFAFAFMLIIIAVFVIFHLWVFLSLAYEKIFSIDRTHGGNYYLILYKMGDGSEIMIRQCESLKEAQSHRDKFLKRRVEFYHYRNLEDFIGSPLTETNCHIEYINKRDFHNYHIFTNQRVVHKDDAK